MNINPNHATSQSQNKQILAYLQAGNALTAIDALRSFGCFRLTSRIYDLTQLGVVISRRYITANNGKRVMEYKLAN